MNISQIITQLTPLFTTLAQKIGESGQWMFELYVRQQYVYAFQSILIGVLAIPFIFLFFRWGGVAYNWNLASILSYGMSGVLVILSIGLLVHGSSMLINPQYYALKDIIGTFIPQPQGN